METDNNSTAAQAAADPASAIQDSMFVVLPWHRLYANALMETDPTKLPLAIKCAEQAVQSRCSEIATNPGEADETVDLEHAIDALRLKRANSEFQSDCCDSKATV